MEINKIFCVGFHKTGTKSLAEALRILGYRVTGPNGVMDSNISKKALSMALEIALKYDAFQDNPWPLLFKEMDTAFHRSKFILTERPTDCWIKSVVQHFGNASTPMRHWIYGIGSPIGYEEFYIQRYERHNNEVKKYFHNRPDDLLILRLHEGDGWEKLCPFLSKEIPNCKFPHTNTASQRTSLKV